MKTTHPITRRSLLTTAGILAATPAFGIEPFKRASASFKGLGVTTYSLKRHMKWWWGKPARGKLDMLDFLDYCAELGLEGAEITSYFFQDPLPKSYDKMRDSSSRTTTTSPYVEP